MSYIDQYNGKNYLPDKRKVDLGVPFLNISYDDRYDGKEYQSYTRTINFGSYSWTEQYNGEDYVSNVSKRNTNNIPINHSWDDGFKRGYITGQINVTEKYESGGIYRETQNGSYKIIETTGIDNINIFREQRNFGSHKSNNNINYNNYIPKYENYKPYIPSYINKR